MIIFTIRPPRSDTSNTLENLTRRDVFGVLFILVSSSWDRVGSSIRSGGGDGGRGGEVIR